MSDTYWLELYLLVGALLFATGAIGFIVRRNLLVMFISVEIMLQGVSVSLIAWSRFHHNLSGQVFVLMIIAVAACEAAVGLALVLVMAKQGRGLDVVGLQELREDGVAPHIDRRIPSVTESQPEWPRLPVAGELPEQDVESEAFRSRV